MKKRILLISIIVTFLGILFFSLVSTQVYYESTLKSNEETLKVYMNVFDESVYSLDNTGAKALSEKLNGARVTIMDSDGDVLGESATDEELENHSGREEVKEAVAEGEGFAVRTSETVGKNMAYYCAKKTIGGTDYLIRIALATDSDWAIYWQCVPTIAIYLLLAVFVCAVGTYLATNLILRPVQKLTDEAALGGEVKTNYKELDEITRILNERNRNIKFQMQVIDDEKKLIKKTQESKNEFIANITHEMNTPLTSIKGYSELLCSGKLTEEQQKLAYNTISTQSERLTNLIACIINYNEIDSDDLQGYDLNLSDLAKETLAVVKPEADKRAVTLIGNIEDNVRVCSRHERMSELLGNLIRNAIRYNKEGGSVTVTLDYKHLSVEDTGVGIAPENLDKVFSRFFTVDKSHSGKNGGFGLGLAVCKRICQSQGWRISVESELGKGSCFTVDFSMN